MDINSPEYQSLLKKEKEEWNRQSKIKARKVGGEIVITPKEEPIETFIDETSITEALEEELKKPIDIQEFAKFAKTIDSNTQDKIKETFNSLKEFLLEKNRRYGDSALEPLDIFNNVINNEPDMAIKGMLIRLADKTKRIKNSKVLRKNDVVDQIGYWILICIKKGWTDFKDLID